MDFRKFRGFGSKNQEKPKVKNTVNPLLFPNRSKRSKKNRKSEILGKKLDFGQFKPLVLNLSFSEPSISEKLLCNDAGVYFPKNP